MRWPVDKPTISPHGAYLFHRTTRDFCAGKPPCDHHGVDLAGEPGTPVFAPESGILAYAFTGDATRPFSRFGPAGVVLLGVESGLYSLLMHLQAPSSFTAQQRAVGGAMYATRLPGTIAVLEGQQVGVMSDRRHVHWEMRRDPADLSTHVDPLGVLRLHSDSQLEPVPGRAVAPAPAPAAAGGSGGGGWIVAILLLLALRRRG